MDKECQNPYLIARNYANMTRVSASIALNISESSLRKYESGCTVPDDMALAMSRLYKTPWLRVQHLEYNSVFCDVFGLPFLHGNSATRVLALQKEVGDVVKVMPDIISETLSETSLSQRIIKECKEAACALAAILGHEKTATGAGTPIAARKAI